MPRTLSLPGLRLLAAAAVLLTLAAMSGTPAGHAPLGAAAAPQPAFTNDNFNSPGLILPPPSPPGLALFPWDGAQSTVGATLEPNETAPCAPIGASVWYIIAADRAGTLEINTSGSNFDTVLSVYTYGNGFLPSPPGGNLVSLGCNDDAGGTTASRVAVHVQRYGQYVIQVAGKNGAAGDLRMHIACNPACPPPNDDQAYATAADLNSYFPRQSFLEDTTAATSEPGEPRPCGSVGATIWYQFYANQDFNVVLDTAGSNFDTVIAVYTPAGLIVPSPPGGTVLVGCNDNAAGGTQSRLSFVAAANTAYWLQVGGASGATGSLVFNVSCNPACPPPNDPFGLYGTIRPPIFDDVNTAGATDEAGEQHPCGGIAKTVWYGVALPGNVSVAVDTAGSDFDTVVAVYELPPNGYSIDAVHNIVCVDDAGSKQARATFTVVAGQAYYVQIGGHAGGSGNLHVNIDCTPTPCPPPNDTSGAPAYIDVPDYLPHTEVVVTRGATVDVGEPLDCGAMGKTVWYQIDARTGALLLFDTAGSDFATALALYQGDFSSPPGALHRVGCAASTSGEPARLQFDAPRFSTLWLQVGGMSAASGELQLLVNCAGPCPPRNDFIDSALQIWAAPEWSDAQNTRAASTEPGEPKDCGNSGSTVWYSLYASSGDLHFSTDGSSFPTSIAVYALEGVSPPGGLAPAACSTTGALDFTPAPGLGYLVQVGGVGGASGDLQLRVHCSGDACPAGIIGPDTGPGGATGAGIRGPISLPDTGSGGYLPGATR